MDTFFKASSTPILTPPVIVTDIDDRPTMALPLPQPHHHQAPQKNARFPFSPTKPILPTSSQNHDDDVVDPCRLINIALQSLPHPPSSPQIVTGQSREPTGNELGKLHQEQQQRATSFGNSIKQRTIKENTPHKLLLSSPARHHGDLGNWVPVSKDSKDPVISSASNRTEIEERGSNLNQKNELYLPHNLPDWKTIGIQFDKLAIRSPTSHPSSHIRQELETNLLRLLNKDMFLKFLRSEKARDEFRRWMMNQNEPLGDDDDDDDDGDKKEDGNRKLYPRGVRKLDRWVDEFRTDEMVDKLRTQCEAVFALYYHQKSDGYVPGIPQEIDDTSLQTLIKLTNAMRDVGEEEGSRLSKSQDWLLKSLYESEFQRFVTSKLVQQTKIKLGRDLSKDESSGLGDSFCLCNPRLADNPIVMVSPGFVAVTGYQKEEIMGRNCRFLQGPRTTSTSIERIRQAIRTGKSCVELLLNYRRDGSPFYCLLNIIPLFDENASVTYYIGGQVNVTGNLESSQELFSLVLDNNNLTATTNNNGTPLSIPNFSREALREPPMDDSPLMKEFVNGGDSLKVFEPVISQVEIPNSKCGGRSDTTTDDRSCIKIKLNGKTQTKQLHSKKDWFSRISSRLHLRRNQESTPGSGEGRVVEKNHNRVLISTGVDAGANDSFGNMALPLEQQFESFESTYSRLLIFKNPSFEIVFATPRALEFLGFQTTTGLQVYRSKILHSNFLQLISEGITKKDPHLLRKGIITAVKQGLPVTFECFLIDGIHNYENDDDFGPSPPPTTAAARVTSSHYHFRRDSKKSKVHLTPLKDSVGNTSAYIVMLT